MKAIVQFLYKKRLMLILAAFVSMFFMIGSSFAANVATMRWQQEVITSLEGQLEAAQRLTNDLSLQIEFTTTDAYIEQAAREQLGFTRPGEIRFTTK